MAAAALRTYAAVTVKLGAQLNDAGFTEWGRHLLRDAELAAIRAGNIEGGGDDEMADVRQFIAEANHADTNKPCIEYRELIELEDAIDLIERLHDEMADVQHGALPIRQCTCEAKVKWERARQVTNRVRQALGMRQRLLDRV